jgi:hypothetical protein
MGKCTTNDHRIYKSSIKYAKRPEEYQIAKKFGFFGLQIYNLATLFDTNERNFDLRMQSIFFLFKSYHPTPWWCSIPRPIAPVSSVAEAGFKQHEFAPKGEL